MNATFTVCASALTWLDWFLFTRFATKYCVVYLEPVRDPVQAYDITRTETKLDLCLRHDFLVVKVFHSARRVLTAMISKTGLILEVTATTITMIFRDTVVAKQMLPGIDVSDVLCNAGKLT